MAKISSQYLFFILLLVLSLFSRLEFSSVTKVTLINLITVVTLIKLHNQPVLPGSLRTLPWVGDISYTLYLVHMPNLYLFDSTFENLQLPTWVGSSAGLITMFPVAVLLSYFLEKPQQPIRSNFRLKPIQFRTYTLYFCAVMVLTIVTIISVNSIIMPEGHEPSANYAGWADPKCQRDSFDGPPCKYLTQNSKEILLLGDSRAGMLSSSLIDVAKGLNMSATIWTHSGCRFNLSQESQQPENCNKNSLDALRYIKYNKPDHIVISQSLSDDESIAELVDSIGQIRTAGVRVTVITPIPVLNDPNFNRRGSLLIPKIQHLDSISVNALNPDSMHLREKYIRAIKRTGLHFIDPFGPLCKNEICFLKKGKLQYFRDSNHLTPAGAKVLEELMSSHIKDYG